MHRPRFAAGRQPGAHCRNDARPELRRIGAGEAGKDGLRHIRVGEQVARGDGVVAVRERVHPEAFRAGEPGDAAGRVDHRDLPMRHMRRRRAEDADHVLRRRAQREQVETARTEPRIGNVLRQHRAGFGARMGAARRHRRRGRGDGDADLPGAQTARGNGKGHRPCPAGSPAKLRTASS
jgi:hypothetical protein